MEEDSMINMAYDEKTGNKRGRDHNEEETHKGIRLEKRPSGIFGVSAAGDGGIEGGESGGDGGDGGGGGMIDAFISNVFNRSGTESEVKNGGFDVGEGEEKNGDLGVDGGGGNGGDGGGNGGDGGGGGGGGIICSFFLNMFPHKGSEDDGDGDQVKSDHLLDEVAQKTEDPGSGGGDNGGGGGGGDELVDLNAEKLVEKNGVLDLPSKDPKGETMKLKPDDYSERVFFLNNN